jgi:hypothetical protein
VLVVTLGFDLGFNEEATFLDELVATVFVVAFFFFFLRSSEASAAAVFVRVFAVFDFVPAVVEAAELVLSASGLRSTVR